MHMCLFKGQSDKKRGNEKRMGVEQKKLEIDVSFLSQSSFFRCSQQSGLGEELRMQVGSPTCTRSPTTWPSFLTPRMHQPEEVSEADRLGLELAFQYWIQAYQAVI